MGKPIYENGARYWGKVTRQALGETKNKYPQFVLSFEVQGRIDSADPGGALVECPRYERSVFRVITDKTIQYVIEDLKVLDFDKASFKFLDPNTPGFVDFTGKELEFFCTHEEYDGSIREKWSIARAQGAFEVEPLGSAEVRKLDSLFGKQLGSLARAKATDKPPMPVNRNNQKAVNQALQEAGAPNDDIPFIWLVPLLVSLGSLGMLV